MTINHKKHQKHGKTIKANFGEFGRLELSVLGTPCGNIKKLSQEIIHKLADHKIAYVDADHKTEEEEESVFLKKGSDLVYTNKINFHRFDIKKPFNKYQNNILFNEFDLVLINGNHFNSSKQIMVIDEKKPLDKKLYKIKDVLMVLFADSDSDIPSYLHDHIENLKELPQYHIGETEKISAEISKYIRNNSPELYGLVLAGGKSTRMQKDKGLLDYYGQPHREYLFHQLSKFTSKTFISCRRDQEEELKENFDVIADSIDELGPFGAILSAMREFPDKAWFVIACDLPFLSENMIAQLVKNRNNSKIATAFYNEETDFPEPLITIWEPKAYPILLNFLALGYSCPRKALINSDIELVQPHSQKELINANNPEEYESAKKQILNH